MRPIQRSPGRDRSDTDPGSLSPHVARGTPVSYRGDCAVSRTGGRTTLLGFPASRYSRRCRATPHGPNSSTLGFPASRYSRRSPPPRNRTQSPGPLSRRWAIFDSHGGAGPAVGQLPPGGAECDEPGEVGASRAIIPPLTWTSRPTPPDAVIRGRPPCLPARPGSVCARPPRRAASLLHARPTRSDWLGGEFPYARRPVSRPSRPAKDPRAPHR